MKIYCLQKNIRSDSGISLIEGQLCQIESIYDTCEDALKAALMKIPSTKFAMIFIHDHLITEISIFNIHNQMKRPQPDTISNAQDFIKFKKWLCFPEKRKTDLCIVGVNHKCNGIQTSIVVYVFPQHCPECDYSSEDPVIASRATAMLITAKYQRQNCPNCELNLTM